MRFPSVKEVSGGPYAGSSATVFSVHSGRFRTFLAKICMQYPASTMNITGLGTKMNVSSNSLPERLLVVECQVDEFQTREGENLPYDIKPSPSES